MKLVELKADKVVNRIKIEAKDADAFLASNPHFLKAPDDVQVGYSYDGAVFSAPEPKSKKALEQEWHEAYLSHFARHMNDPLIATLVEITAKSHAAAHGVSEETALEVIRFTYVDKRQEQRAAQNKRD